ncbi:MAG: ModE family transcriptional regulator [Bacteroidetes bacterium]|nr:MAG: ModE family transcriptional regulator [Bacteroidota bacterium]
MSAVTIKSLQHRGLPFQVGGKLWIECKGKKFFGPGPVELLELIQKEGSIIKAARAMGLSYKKAWAIIDSANRMTARPLVITQSGGKKGGGTLVTDEAKKLIIYHRSLRKRFEQFLKNETKRLNR